MKDRGPKTLLDLHCVRLACANSCYQFRKKQMRTGCICKWVSTLVALVGLIRVPQMSVWCVTTSSMCCGGNQSDQVPTHSCLLEPTATLFSRTLVLLLLHKTALVSVVNPCWSGHSNRANNFQPILLVVIRVVYISGNNWDDHCEYRCSWRQVLLFFDSVTGGRLILLITRRASTIMVVVGQALSDWNSLKPLHCCKAIHHFLTLCLTRKLEQDRKCNESMCFSAMYVQCAM